MTVPLTARALLGVGVVAVAATATLLFGGTIEIAIVTLVGGAAAVMLALALGEPLAPSTAEAVSVVTADPTQSVIEAIVEPVLVIVDSRVALANRAARRLLGEHIVGEDARTAIRHPAAAERLAREDRDSRPIDLAGLGARDQRWQMQVARDVTGRRIVHLIDQTGNYQTERIRVDFVANASHELRTPLAAILGFIETLEDPDAGADPALRARFLKVMFDEARRMQRLVDDLMSLSRIEAEKHRAPDAPVALGELVNEVVAEIRGGGSGRAADLVIDLADGVPDIAGDRSQLSQLLHNLIGNAMKYGRADTPVTVRLGRDGAMALLEVKDRGDGIAAQHIPRLTERFYRVDSGRSRMLGGTGLGLAIVKHIVERHRGRLDIASRQGVGTKVSVSLPLAAPAPGPLSSNGHPTVTQADPTR